MSKTICVYSASSSEIPAKYFEAAGELGKAIALRGDRMLFGGGMNGLMGAAAQSVHQHGGKVIGVIPDALNLKGIVYENCDELVVTTGLRERKAVMDERSDAFVALPGGYGTLEEILEIITLKQLGYHQKPIVILNIGDYYRDLVAQFERSIEERFAVSGNRGLYFVTQSIASGMHYISETIG